MMKRVWLVWFLLACSGGHSVPPSMVVVPDCAGATDARFPVTAIGETAHAVLVAQRDDGGTSPRLLHVSIDGPDAASFVIEDQSSCVSLAGSVDEAPGGRLVVDGETCSVAIAFKPSVEGTQHAVLHLGTTEVPLTARGVTSTARLAATLRNVAMLSGVLTTGSEVDFLILNQGSTPITLGEGGVSDAGLSATNWDLAGQTIAPGGAIQAKLQFFQSVRGCTAGTFTIATSEATLAIPITSRMLGGVKVGYFGGAGSGRVVSSPPGIDCHSGEGMCTWVFFDERVELTAIPDAGSHFSGWVGGCAYDPTCAGSPLPFASGGVPALTHVDAYFASPEAKAVTLHVTGGGVGTVTGDRGNAGPTVTCAHDCTMWLEPGTSLALHAQTPSTFGGWDGACTGADNHCDLGAIMKNRDVTAMFSAEDREVKTLIDPTSVEFAAGAYASDGDLVVVGSPRYFGSNGFVRRQAPDGTVRWSTGFRPYFSPSAVALDATGAIYAIVPFDGVVKLSATGEILWKSGFEPPYGLGPAALSVLPDGRVAELESRNVFIFEANGSTSWFADLGTCVPSAVAASPANIVAVACTDGVIKRFDPTGAALPAWTIPNSAGQTHTVSMAFDATGSLFLHATRLAGSIGSRVIARLDATGAPAFTVIEPVSVIAEGQSYSVARPGLRIASNGQAFLYLSHHARSFGTHLSTADTGGLIQTFTSAGTTSWMVDKPAALGTDANPASDLLSIADAACDATNHCALLGTYSGQELTGWVEVFATP